MVNPVVCNRRGRAIGNRQGVPYNSTRVHRRLGTARIDLFTIGDHMLTEAQARAKAHSELNKPDASWPEKPEIVITATEETAASWVFYYQSKPYLEQGDFTQSLIGNGPLVILKSNGRFAYAATFPPIGERISEAETWLLSNGASGGRSVVYHSGMDSGQTGYCRYRDLNPSAPMGFFSTTTPPAVIEEMLRAGHGAARIVVIEQPGNIFHAINVANKNGHVHFIDTQMGKIVTLRADIPVRLGRP